MLILRGAPSRLNRKVVTTLIPSAFFRLNCFKLKYLVLIDQNNVQLFVLILKSSEFMSANQASFISDSMDSRERWDDSSEVWAKDNQEYDVKFQETAATSQSALQFAAISENEKMSLRAELQGYLSDLKQRRGSDGNPLVHIPNNFDEVANAMDRDDLESAEPAPWSKYLLSRDVTYEASLDADGSSTGRYREIDDDENLSTRRLQEAMARMRLLDSKLKAVNRKDLQLRHDLASRSQRDDSMDIDSEAPSSGRVSARSIASSRMNDHTFLTRARSDKGSTSGDTPAHSAISSPQMSSRTDDDWKNAEIADHIAGDIGSPESAHAAPEEHKSISPSAAPSLRATGAVTTHGRMDAIQRNKQMAGMVKSLTDEEELRLQYLLDIPESSEEWKALSRFGLNLEQEALLRDIDDRLEEAHGRTHRYAASVSDTQLVPATFTEKSDYLTQQRIERETSQASRRLDAQLKHARSALDLSGIVDMVSLDNAFEEGQQADVLQKDPLLDVLEFQEVPEERKISSKDVAAVLNSVRKLMNAAASSSGVANPNNQTQEQDSTDDREADKHLQRLALAPRRDIDRLLCGLQPDVRRLAELRNQLGGLMDQAQKLRGIRDGDCDDPRQNDYGSSALRTASERLHELGAGMEDMQSQYFLQHVSSATHRALIQATEREKSPVPYVPVLEPLIDMAHFRGKLDELKARQERKGLVPTSAAAASISAGLRLRMMRNQQRGADGIDNEVASEEQELPQPPKVGLDGLASLNMPQKLVI